MEITIFYSSTLVVEVYAGHFSKDQIEKWADNKKKEYGFEIDVNINYENGSIYFYRENVVIPETPTVFKYKFTEVKNELL